MFLVRGEATYAPGADVGEYERAVEAVARLREHLGAGTPVPVAVADAMTECFAAMRRLSMEAHDMLRAEIAFSGELVFSALARHPLALEPGELAFLDNVIAALRSLREAKARGFETPAFVTDAFDRWLARLDAS